ncbi:hypothetical protein VTO42DRAFT_4059 [Malbranchea cinnamomea]
MRISSRPPRFLHVMQVNVQVVNVYNAPYGSTDPGRGVECLLSWTPPALPMLLAGDLNLKHVAWQPGSSPNKQAEPFLQ